MLQEPRPGVEPVVSGLHGFARKLQNALPKSRLLDGPRSTNLVTVLSGLRRRRNQQQR